MLPKAETCFNLLARYPSRLSLAPITTHINANAAVFLVNAKMYKRGVNRILEAVTAFVMLSIIMDKAEHYKNTAEDQHSERILSNFARVCESFINHSYSFTYDD